MILITGAAGTVGQELVQQRLEIDQPVRALTRNAHKVAHLDGRAEIAVGDLTRPETLVAAMRDVERMFLLTSSTQQDINALRAARQTASGTWSNFRQSKPATSP